jgi:alpha-L-fucosidase 2
MISKQKPAVLRPWMLAAALLLPGASASAQEPVGIPSNQDLIDASNQLVSGMVGTFSAPPKVFPSTKTVDGPLLGNGDLGAAIGGPANRLAIYFGKNEFWTDSLWYKTNNVPHPLWGGGILPMVKLELQIDALNGASYNMEEALATAEVRGRFKAGNLEVTSRSYVAATENLFVMELSAAGGSPQVTAHLTVVWDQPFHESGKDGDAAFIRLSGDKNVSLPSPEAKVAARVVGAAGTADANGNVSFTLAPGAKAYLVVSVLSSRDTPEYQGAGLQRIKAVTPADLDKLNADHRAWWRGFHGQSFVDIPYPQIEKYWYSSLYLLGSASRKGEAPPGLFGNWITAHPMGWRSDYTLNYNHQASFLALYSSNHLEAADNFPDPLIDWLPMAKEYAAKNLGKKGALYISHIGPYGTASVDTNRWNNMYCGPMAATDIFMHWYSSYDEAYAKKVYPMLTAIADFFEDYMVLENGKYLVYKDEMNEKAVTQEVNNVKTLGGLRVLFKGLIDMSTELGVDEGRRAKWREVLDHLIYPLTAGGTAIRCDEVGSGTGCVTVWAVAQDYFGLESPKDSLDLAYNTIKGMNWWRSNNWAMYFYWAMARMGHDPNAILSQMDGLISASSYPNLHIHSGGGGIENLNVVPTAIDEMLLQSHQGVIRVFSDWPKDKPARFGNLRAYGAFLVSSEIKGGEVRYVRIVSEKGKPAVARNPWPGKSVAVYRNMSKAETLNGDKLAFATSPNEIIFLVPDGAQVSVRAGGSALPAGKVFLGAGRLRVTAPDGGSLEVTMRSMDGREIGAWHGTGGALEAPIATGPGVYLVTATLTARDRAPRTWTEKVAFVP